MSIDVYTVVNFGCNSSASDMWVPSIQVFTDRTKAYEYYHSICPDLDDESAAATEYTLSDGICVIQNSGYHDGEPNCAKRPEGAIIRCHKLDLS